MSFDLSTARPIDQAQPRKKGFDIGTAQPVEQDQPEITQSPTTQPVIKQQPAAQQRSTPLDVAAEAASAINRGVTNVADFLTVDQINAVLSLAGSDKRVPSITELLSSATQGGQMQPGFARDVVRTGGEMVGPGAATGAITRGLVKSLPAVMPGESALIGTARSLGAGTTAGGDIAAASASGVGSEIGEEKGGTPGAIAGAILGPTAVLGAKSGLQSLVKRYGRTVPLVDSAGLPTPEFQSALKRRKVDIADIADDLDTLPKEIKPSSAKELVDDLVKAKLDRGDTAPSLATIRLKMPPPSLKAQRGEIRPGEFLKKAKIVTDELGDKAVKSGFQAGEVASAKGGNDPTRRVMRKMLNLHRQIYRDASKASGFNRPTNFPGQITQKKIDLIMDKAGRLRNQLDFIANKQLKGKTVNFKSLEDKVISDLKGMRINIPDDVPRDVTSIKKHFSNKDAFVGSNIKEDATSQKMIIKTLSILEDAKDGNAQSTHFVKRQIDAFLDDVFGAQPGLKNTGLNFATKVRRYSNQAVREIDEEYKSVNEELSKALGVKESVQKYLTKKTDLANTDLSEKVIGNELRKLFTNYRVGPDINETLKQIDDVAAQFGAKTALVDDFDVDVQRLIQFSNTLDNRFGPVAAPRSFKGETAAGTTLGLEASTSVETMALNATIQGGKKLLKKAIPKKQKDLEAYNAMQRLIKRGK